MEHSARRRPRACPHLAYDGASVLNSLISRFPSVVLKNQTEPPPAWPAQVAWLVEVFSLEVSGKRAP